MNTTFMTPELQQNIDDLQEGLYKESQFIVSLLLKGTKKYRQDPSTLMDPPMDHPMCGLICPPTCLSQCCISRPSKKEEFDIDKISDIDLLSEVDLLSNTDLLSEAELLSYADLLLETKVFDNELFDNNDLYN